ncbi:acyltransferase [Blastococcus sp. TML/M2B]|uniref:acyltransferase family protein n=1 Tax=unclassified Blastococcus TaxID=2619396 RepID=UPI00190AF2CD|nr:MULTISPECIES: acyltransferase family protein [unclassified Blastococcus]MBN1093937.1 acyltransferase [Blastococcus sp. TML/M2B]MBN1095947.1 acyltransferase [Blastococcus sp. TML/C7B]
MSVLAPERPAGERRTLDRPAPHPARRPARPGRPAPATAGHFRPDIQGLRAVAVGLVVLHHVTGRPAGGYIGVDVFFVISGFLITGLLIRERERTGRISFRDFYVRRARRILPAAVVVLAVTSVVAQVLFLGQRAQQTVLDALWSLGFAANVHAAQKGTDYFDAGTAHSPLQHFWSLSVEEQFYVGWPVLVLVVSALVAGRARRLALGGAMLAVCAASFAWSVAATAASPMTAYFSTFTRAWELGAGALVAVAAPALPRVPAALRAVAAWAGLAAIGAAAVTFSAETVFPGHAAAVPVLGAALLVAFGDAPGGPGARLLALRPMRFVGDISYSLYLWHWPVVVLLGAAIGTGTRTFCAAALLASVLLAVASYLGIERPLLRPHPARARALPRRAALARRARGAAALAALGALTGWACIALLPDHRPQPVHAVTAASAPTPDVADAALAQLPAQIRASLDVDEWGPLTPSLDDLPRAKAPEWQLDDCLDVDAGNVDRCVYGDPAAPHRAVVLGDSIAASWVPGLRQALPAAEWSIQLLTWHECPNITATVRGYSEPVLSSCDTHRTWALDRIAADPPDVVIMSNNYAAPLVDRAADVAATWRSGGEQVMGRVLATGARVVVLASPPTSVALEECATAFSSPADCVAPLPGAYPFASGVERDAAAAVGATWVATEEWFCADGRCPAVVGSTPVYVDQLHLTAQYSRSLAPQLRQAVLGG